jgi:hypothetical protein
MTLRFQFTWSSLIIVILLLVSLGLRLHGLTDESISFDEAIVLANSDGLLQKGYPNRQIGPFNLRAYTYEFLPYPIALFQGLFGMNVAALRFPAVLMGVATTLLIYCMGVTLFDRLTGLFAALLYAFAPWAINHSQDLFHPAQDQFLCVLAIYLFYRGAIESEELRPAYIYGAGLSYAFAYLTWEGLGLLLPVFLLSLFVFRWRDWSWMKSGPLWTIGLGITVIVVIEFCLRLTAVYPYLYIGEEMRWLKTPMLAFLQLHHDFWFFWNQFLWAGDRAPVTALALAGLPLLRRDRAYAYLAFILANTIVMIMFFLEHLLAHYFYWGFPLLLLMAARTVTAFLAWSTGFLGVRSKVDLAIKYLVIIVSLGAVFVMSNNTTMLYRLNCPPTNEPQHDRMNYYWTDLMGADNFLINNFNKITVVSYSALTLKLFHNIIINYSATMHPFYPEMYNCTVNPPHLMDLGVGSPSLINIAQFDEAIWYHRPFCYIVHERYKLFDLEIAEYLDKHFRCMFQSYGILVYLSTN